VTTKIYGRSDDLIEFEGDVEGEVGVFLEDDEAALVIFTDGTILEVKYGKPQGGIWAITTVHKGPLFDRIETCEEETDEGYSDIAYLRDGAKLAFAATKWERVK